MTRLSLIATAAGLCWLSGCTIPLATGSPQPSAEALASCDKRGEQVFEAQNRNAIYKADSYDTSQRDAPFSTSGLPEDFHGLADQNARNQDVRDCLNGADETGPVPTISTPFPTP